MEKYKIFFTLVTVAGVIIFFAYLLVSTNLKCRRFENKKRAEEDTQKEKEVREREAPEELFLEVTGEMFPVIVYGTKGPLRRSSVKKINGEKVFFAKHSDGEYTPWECAETEHPSHEWVVYGLTQNSFVVEVIQDRGYSGMIWRCLQINFTTLDQVRGYLKTWIDQTDCLEKGIDLIEYWEK